VFVASCTNVFTVIAARLTQPSNRGVAADIRRQSRADKIKVRTGVNALGYGDAGENVVGDDLLSASARTRSRRSSRLSR
jgi:hypothetical protein